MSTQRLVGTVFLLVAALIYRFNEESKMATFIMWMYVLFGLAAMIHFQPKSLDMKGRAVFITGCDTGLGHELTKALDKLGCIVFAGCYKPDGEGAKNLKSCCSEHLHVLELDVTSDESVEKAINFIREKTNGELWAVVNNAGTRSYGDAELCTMEMYQNHINLNLLGTIRVSKACLKLIRKAKGRIVNITSMRGLAGFPLNGACSISSFGVEAFSNVLRVEMRRWDVQVVTIEPSNFEGRTSLLTNPVNGKNYKDEVRSLWDAMDEDLQEDYGKDYLDAYVKDLTSQVKTAGPSIEPVVEKMLKGVCAQYPRERYLVGTTGGIYDIFTFDIHKVIVNLSYWLPTEIVDFLMEYNMLGSLPLPKALQKKEKRD